MENVEEKIVDKKVTICLTMIIKNESPIMPRLLKSVVEIIDDIVISDTGSTDDTIEVVKKTAEELGKPVYIDQTPFVDFEYNRTLGIKLAQKHSKSTYLLFIDADMILKIDSKFDKQKSLQDADVIQLMQKGSGMEYFNTRIIRRTLEELQYIGVTHEYVSYPNGSKVLLLDRNLMFIDDIGDGRCKGDKYERDYRLLKKGLREKPKFSRYQFYLAETCRHMGKHEESNEYYKMRIKSGGWMEEVYLSYFGMVVNYLSLNNIQKAEKKALESHLFNPNRSEALYVMCEHHRLKGDQQKAMFFYNIGSKIPFPKNDVLFVRTDIYEFLFDYEFAILAYYLQKQYPLDESLRKVTKFMFKMTHKPHHRHLLDGTFLNMKFYIKPLPSEFVRRDLPVATIEGFNSSSTSVLRLGPNRVCYFTRQVNYKIKPVDGSYDYPGYVDTKSSMHIADNEGKVIESPVEVPLDPFCVSWNRPSETLYIRAIEDLKIFTVSPGYDEKKTIYAIGTTRQFTSENNGLNTMAVGVVNLREPSIHSIRPLKRLQECEKNWSPIVGTELCVYSWYPLRFVDLRRSHHDALHMSDIMKCEELPEYFRHIRGSSTGVPEFGDTGDVVKNYWFVTHVVYHGNPRNYVHLLVKMNKDHKIVGATVPFFFDEEKIEFSLGLLVEKHGLKVCYSIYDKCSKEIEIPWHWINRNFVSIG